MTTYVKNEWTAFTEADLLGAGSGNDSFIGIGATFTMPGSATVTMSTYDDDSTLSGDTVTSENSDDTTGQYATVDGARVGSQMYAESYHVLHGSDGRTYYLIEIEVEGYDAPGTGDDYFTFYGAVPPAGVSLTVTQTCNVTGCWVDYSCVGAGDTVPPNTPPHFTNLPEDGIICVDENTTFVIDSNATDADGDALKYEITGGRDARFFEIDAHTGELTFIGAPDYENPQSGGDSNIYDVTIKVSDDKGGSDTKALWIKVKDVDEGTCVEVVGDNLIVNGDFEDNVLNNSNSSLGMSNALSSGWVDIGSAPAQVHEQDYGHGNATGDAIVELECGVIICQEVNIQETGTYRMMFDVTRRGVNDADNKFELYINGVKYETYLATGAETITFDVELDAGTNRFDFKSLSTSYIGAGLDDVKLQQVTETCDPGCDVVETLGPNLIVNGDFEDNVLNNSGSSLGLSNALSSGWVDIGSAPAQVHEQDYGHGNATGDAIVELECGVIICQEVNIQETGTYRMMFDVTRRGVNDADNKFELYINGVKYETYLATGAETITFDVELDAGTNRFDFKSLSTSYIGAGLDDVKLQQVTETCDPGCDVVETLGPNLIVNGDFEDNVLNNSDSSLGMSNALSSGWVDIGSAPAQVHEQDYGHGNATGDAIVELECGVIICQEVNIQETGTYRMMFDVTRRGVNDADNKFELYINGVKYETYLATGAETIMFDVELDAGTNRFDFKSLSTSYIGAGLDDVKLQKVTETSVCDGALEGRYFCDDNGNGVDNGEPGIVGVTVSLLNADGTAVLDADGNAITTVTDGTGNYEFTGLHAGEYRVAFDADPNSKTFIEQNVGTDDTIDSDVDATTGISDVVSVTEGETTSDVDAGVEDPGTAAIEGRVFCDENDNDVRDGGDVDVSGVTVELLDGAGNPVLDGAGDPVTAETAADGSYSFTGLDAGDYQVRFPTVVDGKVLVDANDPNGNGNDTNDSDADQTTGTTGTISVAIGETASNNDAGVEDPGTGALSGRYFCDENDDDVDNGEPGIADALVTLLDAAGNPAQDAGGNVITTTTDANGNYSFTGLLAGTYGVLFAAEATGKEFVAQDDPNNNGDDTNDSDVNVDGIINGITVVIGETTENNDAGVEDPGTAAIEGRVFCDENDNDVRDGGDVDVSGVTVELLDGAGNPVLDGAGDPVTAETAADGSYAFTGLDAGDYQVRFPTVVDGKVLVDANDPNGNGNDTNDSDADQSTGTTGTISVAIGETASNNDAGIEDPGTASVGDYVWLDADGNGVQNGDEDGVEGVNVQLVGAGADGLFDTADDLIFNDTTDENGNYLFENLKAGEYKIIFDRTSTGDLVFTTQNVVAADAAGDDSDADVNTGMTSVFSLDIGEAELDIDAGLVAVNTVPDPQDDAGMTCADEKLTVAVLENDGDLNFEGDIVDADGDVLTITAVDGQAISEGQENAVTTGAGTIVTLLNGELMFDGEAAYAALDIGETQLEDITYTVSDGTDSADANVAVTFCGDANSVESLVESIPTGEITYQVQSSNIELPVEEYAFNVVLSGTGDARFDDNVIFEAYCIDRGEPVGRAEQFVDAPLNTGVLIGSGEANAGDVFNVDQVSFFNGQSAADNLDLINYILNEDYENNGFTGWEVQRAIWELTDGDDLEYLDGIDAGFGLDDNVDFILSQAAANGEGFVAGVGDKIGIIIDPGHADSSNLQPFIIAIDFEDYDCIC